jgi:hypothetical protein
MLTKSVENAVADLPSRLRRDVAECDTGTAGRDHQGCEGCLPANFGRDMDCVIRNDCVPLNGKARLLQSQRDGWARSIDPKPLKTRVAYRNYDGVHSCDFSLWRPDLSVRIDIRQGAKTSKNETMVQGRNIDTGT